MNARFIVLVVAASSLAARPLEAQSRQRFSVQGSALGATLYGSAYQGMASAVGWEAQLRFTPSALSVGVGVQRSDHVLAGFSNPVRLMGGFVEPRYVLSILSRTWMAPYVSARVSLLEQRLVVGTVSSSATGLTANLGGGLMIRLTGRVNGEAGMTFGFTRFGTSSAGTPSGQGSNVVMRLGLAMGVLR